MAWLRGRRHDAVIVGAIALVIVFLSPVITSYDSRWTVPTAISLERHGDLTLDEYAPAVTRANDYGTVHDHGHTYDMFPWATAVLVAPFVFVADRVGSLAGIHLERDAIEQQKTGGAQR